jgi:hypothetical protein
MKKRCLICLEILIKEDEFTYSCDGDEETLASSGWKRDAQDDNYQYLVTNLLSTRRR